MFKVSEFAEKAGVTVRTLHHYDRLGLLKPSGRTEAGYRFFPILTLLAFIVSSIRFAPLWPPGQQDAKPRRICIHLAHSAAQCRWCNPASLWQHALPEEKFHAEKSVHHCFLRRVDGDGPDHT